MEIFYIDKVIDLNEFRDFLSSIFPDLIVFHYNFNDNPPSDFDSNNETHIFFNFTVMELIKDFSIEVTIFRTLGINEEERSLFIGRKVAKHFKTRVLVPVKDPVGHDPYMSALFDNETASIVDDSKWEYNDVSLSDKFPIQDIYNYSDFKFDASGHLR